MKQRWADRAAMLTIALLILAAFSALMRVAAWIGPDNNKPCTVADVNSGVDRCQPDIPPELPSGTD